MSTLHIDVYEHAGFVTVSEMRRMIARAIAKLKGDDSVIYSLHAQLPDQFRIIIADTTPHSENVSGMRRHLSRFLPNLNGDDPVTFSFHCRVVVN